LGDAQAEAPGALLELPVLLEERLGPTRTLGDPLFGGPEPIENDVFSPRRLATVYPAGQI
jgi:hypothetical protein